MADYSIKRGFFFWEEVLGFNGMGFYPRIVSKILMRRSAPQPAIMKTPAGGTAIGN